MKRFYRSMISMFIVISFIYPFTTVNGRQSFYFNFDESQMYDSNESMYETMIEKEITESLENGGFVGCQVSSSISIENNEITVDDVQISIPDEYDAENVKNYIFDNLGINARVINIGD
ncbi:MAG: hypothetical protein ACI4IG_03325 [Eubacterium sp.]